MPSAGSKSPYFTCVPQERVGKVWLNQRGNDTVGKKTRTSTDLAYVSNDDFADEYLAAFAPAYDGELVFALDAALQPAELSLLGIIIEGSYQDDDNDGYQNGETLDPFVRLILLVAIYNRTCGNITL